MRTNLSLKDLGDLLEQPIVAVLATYRHDGWNFRDEVGASDPV